MRRITYFYHIYFNIRYSLMSFQNNISEDGYLNLHAAASISTLSPPSATSSTLAKATEETLYTWNHLDQLTRKLEKQKGCSPHPAKRLRPLSLRFLQCEGSCWGTRCPRAYPRVCWEVTSQQKTRILIIQSFLFNSSYKKSWRSKENSHPSVPISHWKSNPFSMRRCLT